MTKRKLYIFIVSTLLLLFGVSSQANTIIPQIMLLLSGNEGSQIVSATYDEVRFDLITLE